MCYLASPAASKAIWPGLYCSSPPANISSQKDVWRIPKVANGAREREICRKCLSWLSVSPSVQAETTIEGEGKEREIEGKEKEPCFPYVD